MESLPELKPPLYDRIGGRDGLLRLLRHFYADVRQHREIGPIFNARIHDWPAHLANIADFWSTALGGPPTYGRAMPAPHLALGLTPRHFEVWLDLWARQCAARLPRAEAAELSARAHAIGARLRHLTELAEQPA